MASRKTRRMVHSRKNRVAKKLREINGKSLLVAGSLLSLGTVALNSTDIILSVGGNLVSAMVNKENESTFEGKEQLLENPLLLEETEKAKAAITEKWEIKTLDEVKAEIERQVELGLEAYVVQWGDTLEVLAEATGETVEHLAEVNQVNEKDLILTGDLLIGVMEAFELEVDEAVAGSETVAQATNTNTNKPNPPTVKPAPEAKVEIKELEEIELLPFEIEEKENSALFVGEQVILQEGVNGEKTVQYKITLTNGIETAREVVSEEITKEVINHIIEIGTKDKIEVTTETKTENIPFEISEIKNDDLLKGESKVVQVGLVGTKVITYEITVTNGKETSREILSEEVTKAAIGQIVEVGTKVVVTSKEEVKEVSIAFVTEEKENADLPKGEVKTVQEGQAGVKTITYQVTYENDVEVSRKVISEDITKVAVNKIVEIGTKDIITTQNETKEEVIAFETEKKENADLTLGETRVAQKGVNGLKTQIYAITFTNGKETKRELIEEKTLLAPVKEILEVGTKVVEENHEYVTVTFGSYWDEEGMHQLDPIKVKKGETIKLPVLAETEYEKFGSWADYPKYSEAKGKHFDSTTPIEEDVFLMPHMLRKFQIQFNTRPPYVFSDPENMGDYITDPLHLVEGDSLKGLLPKLPKYDGFELWDWTDGYNYFTEDSKVEGVRYTTQLLSPNWVEIEIPLPEITEDELYIVIRKPIGTGMGMEQTDRIEVIKKGSTVNLTDQEVEGYVFTKWHNEQSGTEVITNETIFERNAVLFPVFTRKITIRLYSEEDELFTEIPHIEGERLGELPKPIKEGYVHYGWYTSPNGYGASYSEGVRAHADDEPILNLYASWRKDWRLLTTSNLMAEETSDESENELIEDLTQDEALVSETIDQADESDPIEELNETDSEDTSDETSDNTSDNTSEDQTIEKNQADDEVEDVLDTDETDVAPFIEVTETLIETNINEVESVETPADSTVVSQD